jgi:hypothetical protein
MFRANGPLVLIFVDLIRAPLSTESQQLRLPLAVSLLRCSSFYLILEIYSYIDENSTSDSDFSCLKRLNFVGELFTDYFSIRFFAIASMHDLCTYSSCVSEASKTTAKVSNSVSKYFTRYQLIACM